MNDTHGLDDYKAPETAREEITDIRDLLDRALSDSRSYFADNDDAIVLRFLSRVEIARNNLTGVLARYSEFTEVERLHGYIEDALFALEQPHNNDLIHIIKAQILLREALGKKEGAE